MGILATIKGMFGKGVSADVFSAGFGRQNSWSNPRLNGQAWLEKFGRSAHLRPAVARVATDLAMVQWNLYRQQPDGKRKVERAHPILNLWRRPCPFFTGYQVRWMAGVWREVIGETFYLIEWGKVERKKVPIGLWPVPGSWITSLPRPEQEWFLVRLPNGITMEVPPDDIVWDFEPNPADPYGRGLGAAGAVDDEISQLEWMGKWNNQLFRQGAHPGLIVSVEDLTDQNYKRMKEQWDSNYSGYMNAFKTAIVGGKTSIHQTTSGHKDLDFNKGLTLKRDTINQNWCLPPEVLGIVENSNRATADAALNIHQRQNLRPRCVIQRELWNTFIVPLWGEPDLEMDFVDPVQESAEFHLQRASEGLTRGALTVDEWREANGWDPLKGKGGDERLIPQNVGPAALNSQGPGNRETMPGKSLDLYMEELHAKRSQKL